MLENRNDCNRGAIETRPPLARRCSSSVPAQAPASSSSRKSATRPRVLVADDHSFYVDGFACILEPDYQLVGAVRNGRELLVAVGELEPDVILLDVAMPELDGIEAARRLKIKMPEVKLIFLTSHDEPDIVTRAWQAGASAYVHKSSASWEVFRALEVVLSGRLYVPPRIGAILADAAADGQGRETAARLTERQTAVLRLLAQGKIMKEAARILGVTARTIADHKYRIMDKLGVTTSAELVRYAFQHDLI